jgi:hypothetical protein
MQDAIAILEQLNIDIGDKESAGERDWLDGILAPVLAFRRAKGKMECRHSFLDSVACSDKRETQIESINLYGNRAVVTCIVTIKFEDGDKRYHNLRLFVRHKEGWKLLGWANEEVEETAEG